MQEGRARFCPCSVSFSASRGLRMDRIGATHVPRKNCADGRRWTHLRFGSCLQGGTEFAAVRRSSPGWNWDLREVDPLGADNADGTKAMHYSAPTLPKVGVVQLCCGHPPTSEPLLNLWRGSSMIQSSMPEGASAVVWPGDKTPCWIHERS